MEVIVVAGDAGAEGELESSDLVISGTSSDLCPVYNRIQNVSDPNWRGLKERK